MIRLWKVALARIGLGSNIESKPLIAGYHRMSPRPLMALGLVVLVVALFAYGFYFALWAPSRMMPFVVAPAILAGLVVWGLPSGARAPVSALEPLFVAFFVALILWPNYLAIGLPSLPWITMLRLIATPLILVLLICLSVSVVFRRKLADVLNVDKTTWRLLVLLVVLQTISLPFSTDVGSSINRYIIAQMNWTAIFIVSVIVFMRRGFAEHWTRILLATLTVLCFVGLWEAQLSHVPWAGHIPAIFRIDDESVLRILSGASRAATKIYRVQATSTTPLGFAEILGLAVPFAIHLALEKYPVILRVAAAAFIPLSVYLILLTDSRLGMVAALGSVMVYLLIWALIRWRQERGGLIGPAIVLTYPAIFVAFIAATLFVGRLRATVWGDGSQSASDETRKLQWAMAIPKIFDRPLGHGFAQGGEVLGFTNGAGVGTIDSYYLSILLEIGIIGFVVYYALIVRSAWIAAKTVVMSRQEQEVRLLLPISVSLVNYVVVKAVLSQDANHPMIFIMLGAVVALTYRSLQDAKRTPLIENAPEAPRIGQSKPKRLSFGRYEVKPRLQDLGWLPLVASITTGSALTLGALVLLRTVF